MTGGESKAVRSDEAEASGSGSGSGAEAGGDPLSRLAAETGTLLAELGVRPGDAGWIDLHAETIASLAKAGPPPRAVLPGGRGGWGGILYRLARRAARTAR